MFPGTHLLGKAAKHFLSSTAAICCHNGLGSEVKGTAEIRHTCSIGDMVASNRNVVRMLFQASD